MNPQGFPPQPRDGKTYRSSALLVAYQHVIYSNRPVVVLADLAAGLSLIRNSYNSGLNDCGWWYCVPEIGSRYSAGIAFLLPIHAHIGLQATMRTDLLRVKGKYPFTSGMSVAFGLLYEVD